MATCLYRESRLNLDPAHSKSTIDILVPASSTSAFSSRPSPKRRRLNDAAPVYDEKTFQNGHLASDASIYFRPSHHELTKGRGPRAILWRVLEEGTVLELQAVDLWQDDDTREPDLTLRVSFSGTIRPHGVTFAERKAEGSSPHAVAFVLTTSGELFTLDLRREVFIKSEVEVSTWCARSSIGALSSRNPFKLFASSDDELWASLGDGSLLRLDRKQGISGSKWQETYYAERGWRTSVRGLGGLIAWKGIVKARFGDVELYAGTAVSMALSPDSKYMWTACLDHTVKAWDVGTGKLAFNADLVGDTNRDLQRPVDHLLNPQHSELLRILPSRVIDEYTVVTFSPHTRQFKFWTIRDLEHAEHGVEDMRPDLRLIPPIEDMTETAIWSIETFHVSPPQASGDTWSLWLLVRCGARCSTFNLKFRMDSHVDALAKAWEENWTGVDCGSNTVDHLKEHSDALERIASTGEDVVTQWCDFLFYPGRFSLSTLETAVTVFRSSLGRNAMKRSSNNMGSLKERLCEIVGLSCELTHSHDGTPAYEKYQQDIANQWRTFYGVVRDLHKRRSDSLTLAFNPELDAPWLVMADQVAPLREASECELLWLNRDVPPEDLHADSILVRALRGTEAVEVAKLFYAIDIFRQNLPAQFVRKFSRVINTEILQSLDASDEHIELSHDLEAIYEKSGFLNQVSDDDYNQLTDALKPLGGIAKIVSDMILSVLDFLEEARQGSPQRRTLTRYGARAMSRGSQEILELGSEILLDCLLLVVFMGAELEEGDLSQSFDAASIFAALMHRAKQYHFLSWLASTVIVIESEPKPSVSDTSSNTALALINDAVETNDSSITILEFMCLGDWSVMETLPVTSQARALTYWSRALTLGMNLSKSYTFIACHIMASFIKLEEARLAFEFMKFLPETPWSVYLQARLYLIAGQTDTAARLFQSAGLDLVNSKYFDADLEDPASLLDMDDREHFNEGLARYYQHVVKVFDNEHCMSYVAEFTELGLEAYEEEGTEDPKLKNDLLCRQIQASLAICRFDTTCAALARLSDAALQKSYTTKLLAAILKRPDTEVLRLLTTLHFPASIEVDTYLASCAAKVTPMNIVPQSRHTTSSTSLLDNSLRSTSQQTPQYHKLLYTYRLHADDLRGASTCLYDRLQLLIRARDTGVTPAATKTKSGNGFVRMGTFDVTDYTSDDDDAESASSLLDEDIAQTYLILINTLSLLPADDAWLLFRPLPPSAKQVVPGKLGANRGQVNGEKDAETRRKRKVVRLEDVRREWQVELDRRADFRAGRFAAFGWQDGEDEGEEVEGSGEMEVDALF